MSTDGTKQNTPRHRMFSVLASATAADLHAGVATFGDLGHIVDLKPAETGLVMLRGRIGGDGAPFNVGEATITKAVVRLAGGEIGYGFRLGRDVAATRAAAILDALWQSPGTRERIETTVLGPISAHVEATRAEASTETAGTRVNFFTLARETT
jgi:alpha-D-ribose 1-methylphosphonate 5-triphosphate synthase subunit PhnG